MTDMSGKGAYMEDVCGRCANCRFLSDRRGRAYCARSGDPIRHVVYDCALHSPQKGSITEEFI